MALSFNNLAGKEDVVALSNINEIYNCQCAYVIEPDDWLKPRFATKLTIGGGVKAPCTVHALNIPHVRQI